MPAMFRLLYCDASGSGLLLADLYAAALGENEAGEGGWKHSLMSVLTVILLLLAVQSNQPPEIYAGADQSIAISNSAQLAATASDDGLPAGTVLLTKWIQISGPGIAVFTDDTDPASRVSFSQPGE